MEIRDSRKMEDGIDRRGMLRCMAWVGTGLVWSLRSGILSSQAFGQEVQPAAATDFSFVQISDSHIGFMRDPNKDVAGTLKVAIDRINNLPETPAFLLHTGDLTHLARPAEFDAVAELLKGVKTEKVFYVPGEHDFDNDDNKLYLERFGQGTRGTGWHSFDYKGMHFVGLVNVASAKSGSPAGLGVLGPEQLDWLKQDVASHGSSTPIVVFAHVPLWTIYAKWGWGTQDAEQALALLKRFASVTVLNGHIHQVMQKTEGNIVFHTARSTAFPQGEPGKGSPGPVRDVPAERLRRVLGLSRVSYVAKESSLAVVDPTLE
jgi:3',5'-cyclic-AMP phosphodiesterase